MPRQSKIEQADIAAISDRLRALRETTGMTQAQFAEHVGLNYKQWGNFEAAFSRIGIDAALQLVREMRVTLDWIYLADDRWLPKELATQIAHALANPTTKRASRRKPED
jgi:transcriptional regulator with XRE-family HTH domain